MRRMHEEFALTSSKSGASSFWIATTAKS